MLSSRACPGGKDDFGANGGWPGFDVGACPLCLAQWWREGVEDGRDKSCPIDVTGYSVSKLKL